MLNDRRIHGTTADGGEIVRYDRAGKWFIEYPASALVPAQHVTIGQAVKSALSGNYFLGLPGGSAFDRRLRDLRARTSSDAGGSNV